MDEPLAVPYPLPAIDAKEGTTPMYKFLYMPIDFDLRTARLVT
jgi:hypothetical protein